MPLAWRSRLLRRYADWSRREHSEGRRLALLGLLAPVFLGLLPALVIGGGSRVDRRLGWDRRREGAGTRARQAGGLGLAAGGFGLAFWTIDAQLGAGRGTPLPVMPTQALLTDGPYRLCRNPMTLGAILAYGGLAVAGDTRAGLGVVAVLSGGLLAYLHGIEERELAERFGPAYRAYRRQTPFLVPRLPVRQASRLRRRPG